MRKVASAHDMASMHGSSAHRDIDGDLAKQIEQRELVRPGKMSPALRAVGT